MIQKLPAAAGSKISITTTATSLRSLINTAAGSAIAEVIPVNFLIITPEDGNIRYLSDGNTPTTTVGVLVNNSEMRIITGDNMLDKCLLISTSGTVAASVQIGSII